jgi:hypothetical protein
MDREVDPTSSLALALTCAVPSTRRTPFSPLDFPQTLQKLPHDRISFPTLDADRDELETFERRLMDTPSLLDYAP